MKRIPLIFLFTVLLLINVPTIFSETPLPITKSYDMENVIFDGKWTTPLEWKRTSLESIVFETEEVIKLRFGHQDEFVYVMLDIVTDRDIDSKGDQAIICFDTKNDKSQMLDENDFCFKSVLDEDSITLKGDLKENKIIQINNSKEFLAVGGVSDENDFYDKSNPHVVFEFRIPTEVITRQSTYGFFISYHDANSNTTSAWPTDITIENKDHIPSPSLWGEMVSPDKSLPEFHFPMLILIPIIFTIIVITRLKSNVFRIAQ